MSLREKWRARSFERETGEKKLGEGEKDYVDVVTVDGLYEIVDEDQKA